MLRFSTGIVSMAVAFFTSERVGFTAIDDRRNILHRDLCRYAGGVQVGSTNAAWKLAGSARRPSRQTLVR